MLDPTSRGLKIVSDDGALITVIDDASLPSPRLEKIRDGKVQATDAVIGAVMKVIKSQAMRRVRELVLERTTQGWPARMALTRRCPWSAVPRSTL